MTDLVRMLGGVAIRRTIAAECYTTRLASAQMNPSRACLHTLFTDKLGGKLDGGNRSNVFAGFNSHRLYERVM